jgi:hypothetical protein
MEAAWSPDARDAGTPKDSVNSLVGVMAMPVNSEALSVVSGGPADGAGHYVRQEFQWGVFPQNTPGDEPESSPVEMPGTSTSVIDWVHCTRLLDNVSWRPIHDFIMAHEHVAVAHAYRAIKRLQIPCAFLDVKTDALNLLVATRHVPKVKEACTVAYQDLHKTPNLFGGAVPLHPRLGAGPVFRFKPHGKRLQGQYRTPRKDAAPPQPRASWQQLSEAQALEAVLEGESLLVTGMPGVGQSYWAAQVCARLEPKRISVIAKTHASVANMNAHLLAAGSSVRAVTADHWANACVRRGACNCDCLIVEECSMINSHLWDEIAKFALLCPQVICIGDFRQFGPTCDVYCGTPVRVDLERSDLLLQLCAGQRLELTENKRSDPQLFRFYSAVNPQTFELALLQARLEFPVRGPARYSLCISHATRMAVNRKANLHEKIMQFGADSDAKCAQICDDLQEKNLKVVHYKAPASKEDNRPQSFWCWPGLELIGAGGRTKKGIFYTVLACDEKRLTVEGNGEQLTVSAEMACKCLRLSHAITYASCQGLSLDGVRLLDTNSPHFTWRHLYVGASRCTSSATLQVA